MPFLQSVKDKPYTYDPDCPLLTEEQLLEFKPVHFATEEERRASFKEAGIANPDIKIDLKEPVTD